MSEQRPLFGVSSETWVKWLVAGLVSLILIQVGWAFRVETRASNLATDSEVRAQIKEAVVEMRGRNQDNRRRVELLELGASKQETMLLNIQAGIEEIKRDLRQLRRGRSRHR